METMVKRGTRGECRDVCCNKAKAYQSSVSVLDTTRIDKGRYATVHLDK